MTAGPAARPGALRDLAADVLAAVDAGMHGNRAVLEHLERRPDLSPRDRGLVTHLVYGVLRHRLRLDAHVDAAATRPRRIRARPRNLLRIGAYELLELQTPLHAVVAEIRAATRRIAGGGGIAPALEAILRRIARDGAARDAALENLPPLDRLERRYSIPRWWAGRWLRQFGPERAVARARALARVPAIEVFVPPPQDPAQVAEDLVAERPGLRVRPIPNAPRGLALEAAGDVFFGALAQRGAFWVQSGPSQRVVHLLDPRPGERVLDLCAGRGTKTRQIAALLGGRGHVTAADVKERRLAELAARALAPGTVPAPDGGLTTRRLDATGPCPPDLARRFDAVLVDAPCTGLGEAGRRPEVRYRRTFEDIGRCAARQARILETALGTLAPGGRLVYAVCSLEPEEGPSVVRAVLEARPGFAVVTEWTACPEEGASAGFYAARIEAAAGAQGA